MNWIKVTNDLPQNCVDVLITDGSRIVIGDYNSARMGGKWALVTANFFEPTHWMALPKLPRITNLKQSNMEILAEIKAKIFAQYLFQNMECEVKTGEHWQQRSFLDEIKNGQIIVTGKSFPYSRAISFNECRMLVKPLSAITDEDAIEVAKMCHSFSHKDDHVLKHEGHDLIKNYLYRQSNIHGIDWYKIFQYLQSRRYALPYLNYTVEQLVEAGIYKLIEP